MRFKAVELLLIGMLGTCVGSQILEVNPENLDVAVSRGAHVTPLDGTTMYTSTEYLWFTIPDIPDPPSYTEINCDHFDDEACKMFTGMQEGIKDISTMLTVVNRILTTRGLKTMTPKDIVFPDAWLQRIRGVTVASGEPAPEIISAAGREWYSDLEARLALRKILSNRADELTSREKRWVQAVIKAGVMLASKATFLGDVQQIFNKLFVGDKTILTLLTKYRAFAQAGFKIFADLPDRVSELEVETKQMLLDVLNSTSFVKNISLEVQKELDNQKLTLSTIQETVLLEQNTMADIIRYLFTTATYSIHFSMFEECRSSKLPVAYVPPQLLHDRLLEIEKRLPASVRLAIPVEEYQRYYRLQLTSCIFDSSGGLIKLAVPLVEVSANYKLYEFRALHFAHEDQTCAIETLSSFIVKDVKNNRIFSVTETDEELCQPRTTALCRVPLAAADDSNNFCASVLLSGEPASVVKEACKLRCFRDQKYSVSQIGDSTFVGIHLPANTKLECPQETIALKQPIRHGSVRFTTVCNCNITVGGKIVEASTQKYCDEREAPKVEMLLPVQMTTFTDLLPFSNDGRDSTVFSTAAEIYDPKFTAVTPPLQLKDEDDVYYLIVTFLWNAFQSVVIIYLYNKVNGIFATTLAVPGQARALRNTECTIPDDVYFLLYAILIVALLEVLPRVAYAILRACQRAYNEQVEVAARRVAIEQA